MENADNGQKGIEVAKRIAGGAMFNLAQGWLVEWLPGMAGHQFNGR
jgi:hypothetical protein